MVRASIRRLPQTDRGLILIEGSGSTIAADRGAANILRYLSDGTGTPKGAIIVGEDTLQMLYEGDGAADPILLKRVRVGVGEFTCRAYILEKQERGAVAPERLVAVLLERVCEAPRAIKELAAEYHLTKREQQALRGIASGISSKTLAARMNITPSTLRAFLQLIKVKMGVSTRAGIMAKILEKTTS